MSKKSYSENYELRVVTQFSAAHRLIGYLGKCESLHGHNWKVELTVSSKKLNKIGMVYDFSELKKFLNDIVSKFDHKCLNDIAPFNKLNPTCENIAKYFFELFNKKSKLKNFKVTKVTIWENTTQSASYERIA